MSWMDDNKIPPFQLAFVDDWFDGKSIAEITEGRDTDEEIVMRNILRDYVLAMESLVSAIRGANDKWIKYPLRDGCAK